MPFTLEQVENVANSTLDFYMKKGRAQEQHIQDKPLLSLLRKKKKTIPGGKGRVDMPVLLETVSQLQGFEYDDEVSYASPAKTRRVSYPYRLFHIGTQFTMHELIHDGISVVDSVDGKKTTEHSKRELTMLVNILEAKFRDMDEGFEDGLNKMYWRDGTTDAPGGGTAFPGITSIVVDDPTAATIVGGIDQSANAKWRNRANLSITLGDSTGASQAVVRTLDAELPQLKRYGGKPSVAFAGSDMIDRLKAEYRAKGEYTQSGFTGKKDLGAGELSFNGIDIHYDPTLDDLGYAKRLYLLDIRSSGGGIFPFAVEGEDEKMHNPARPENKYVFYKAKTWVGGLACDRRNGCGVYAFA
jgi:hypothetical protein